MGLVTNSDRDLLERIKIGDESAFRKAYNKYQNKLYGLAFRYLRTRQRAEDVVHDTFVKLWNSRESLDPSGSLRGFLFTATKNRVLNLISRNKRALQKDIQWTYQQKMDRRQPAGVVDLSEYRRALQAAVEGLPEKRRQIYELRMDEGLTSREVAAHLDISIHTVKSQYWKATKYIRAYVSENINMEAVS